MRKIFALALFAAVTLYSGAASALYISEDHGGRIGDYYQKYDAVRHSGETVIIDGPCLSACTMVTMAVSKDKICVTQKAVLGFHRAFDYKRGREVTNKYATAEMYVSYPRDVRRWISRHGGLRKRLIELKDAELQQIYRPCY